jgi:hypothetical protein
MDKYFFTPLKQRLLSVLVTRKQLEEWYASWKVFFILAHGRSGTNFLANLLGQSQEAYVFHEPVLEDFSAYLKAFHDPESAGNYMRGFRKTEIYLRMRHVPTGVYGEVNGMLRRHAAAIQIAFPAVTLIHLVRDGRDVVRSTMSRKLVPIRNLYFMGIYPRKMDPWRARWKDMDRFSRVCWLWQEENALLRKEINKTVQFEKILSDYEYFYSEILEPCQIFLDKKVWEAAVASPRNITSSFEMPKWKDWTPEQQKTFREICGDEMEKCGYRF